MLAGRAVETTRTAGTESVRLKGVKNSLPYRGTRGEAEEIRRAEGDVLFLPSAFDGNNDVPAVRGKAFDDKMTVGSDRLLCGCLLRDCKKNTQGSSSTRSREEPQKSRESDLPSGSGSHSEMSSSFSLSVKPAANRTP
jgi:hypothetical protein